MNPPVQEGDSISFIVDTVTVPAPSSAESADAISDPLTVVVMSGVDKRIVPHKLDVEAHASGLANVLESRSIVSVLLVGTDTTKYFVKEQGPLPFRQLFPTQSSRSNNATYLLTCVEDKP
jgi:hypothetical protein